MYHIFFIHSSIDGYSHCFHGLTIVNSSAMKIGLHVSFGIVVFFGYMPRSRIARSYYSFIFKANFILLLQSGHINLHFHIHHASHSIQSAKPRPGADCGSDDELLIAKFRLKLKKVGKTNRTFRYDLNQVPYDYTIEVTNRFKGLDLLRQSA